MKKILSLVMVLALILSCMCLPASADVKYDVTLRVEVFDRSIAGLNLEDCWQLRYAQEHFGDPNGIKLQFVPVSRWEEGDILTTQISGETAADICITYNGDLVNSLIADEGLVALDELIAEYGQNIKAFLGENLLSYGTFDPDEDGEKTQYTIPARRISVVNQGTFIRADWLKALNMEEPKTIAELEAYLYAAKEANLGGNMTIPFNYAIFTTNPMFAMRYYMSAFIDFANITELAVKKIFADYGVIEEIVISEGTVVKELVGVRIKGDLIEANTLKADSLVVKGDDGIYYRLNIECGAITDPEALTNEEL